MDDADSGAEAPSVALGDTSPCGGGTGRAPPTPYSTQLVRAVTARVAMGESVEAICEEAGMPHRATLARWVKTRPRVAEAMRLARAAAGRDARARELSAYCTATGAAICERIAEGETLSAICRDPLMPGYSTVQRWRRTFAGFAEAFDGARAAMADRIVDESVEIVRAIAADSAQALHVRLNHLRWTAGVWAPRSYHVRMTEPPPPPEPPRTTTILVRHFHIEQRESDGWVRVVGFQPNHVTGKVERTSEGEWGRPPDPASGCVYVERKYVDEPPAGPPRELSPEDEQWL